MARKSRKQIAVEEPVIESVSSEVFSTAIYARLSVENSGKSEKVDVIANQIEICKSYIAERPYLKMCIRDRPQPASRLPLQSRRTQKNMLQVYYSLCSSSSIFSFPSFSMKYSRASSNVAI